MPRRGNNITPALRQEWLQQYELGKTFKEIARTSRKDQRTVKAHIERATQEQEIRLARGDQIRRALDRHSHDLLETATRIRERIHVLPDERFTPIAAFPTSTVGSRFGDGYHIDPDELTVVADSGGDARSEKLARLLREHLRDERTLWRDLDNWWKAWVEYVEGCLQLGRSVASEFETATGLRPVAAGGSAPGFHEALVSWLCRLALETAGSIGSSPAPEVEASSGQLRLDGSTLAVPDSATRLETARHAFLTTLKKLSDSPEARRVARLNELLESDGESIRDRLEDILLFEYISGRCRVCAKHSV